MSRLVYVLCCCMAAANLASFAQAQDADNDGLPTAWEEANRLNPNLISDATADSDGDGIVNLLEYVWGGDPNRADPEIKPAGGILDNQFFTVSFNRRLSASGFTVQIERAESLQSGNWITDGFTEVSRASLNADLERLTYRLSTVITGSPRQFVRVTVRRASTPAIPEFTYHVIDSTIIHGQGLTVVDIDGDQDQDVIAALSLTDSIYLYLNGSNSSGGGVGSSWSTVKVAADNSIVGMQTAVADFDADGDPDIAAVGLFDRACTFCSPGTVVWYAQSTTASRAWIARPVLPQLQGARYIFAGDLSGDGLPDLVASAVDIGGSGRGLFWMRNGNNGLGWSARLNIDENLGQAEKVVIYDVDRDGSPDLVALSKTENLIFWYENGRGSNQVQETPVFTRHVLANVTTPDFFYVANMDEDAESELVISSAGGIEILNARSDPALPWLRQTVDADFGNTPLSRLFAADLDGDGSSDIAAASNARQEIRWYRNTGGTTWASRMIRTDYAGLTDIVPGDLNRDGRIDILTSTYNHDATDRIAWWENVASSLANRPPVGSMPSNQNVAAGGTLTVTINASDPDGDALTFSLAGSIPIGAGIDSITGVFTWQPSPQDSGNTFMIDFRVSDGSLVATGSFQVTVRTAGAGGDDTTEVLLHSSFNDIASIQSPIAGLGGTTTLTPSDFVAGRTNTAASFANGRHARFPTGEADGRQNINLEKGEIEFWYRPNFSSSAGDDQKHVLLVAGDIYGAPRFEISESDRISFNIVDRDFNFHTVQSEYHAPLFQTGQWVHVKAAWDRGSTNDSVALYIDGQRIGGGGVVGNWNVGEASAFPGIFVGAGNEGGEFGADGLMDDLVIRGPGAAAGANQRPIMEAIAPRTVRQGESVSFAVSARDPDNGELTYSIAGNGPAGAVIHPQTGVFTWTPDLATTPGTFSITIRVEDNGTPIQFSTSVVPITVEANTAPEVCPSGPALAGALAGNLGPAPQGSFTSITCFEIRNDQPVERTEIATAGIPIPRELDLRSTEGLAVIGPGENRLAAQFNVISRWGGPVDQANLPVRWLQVSTASRVSPGGKSIYSLRRYNSLPAVQDEFAAVLLPTGLLRLSTGVTEIILDPSNPALIGDITDISQSGTRQSIYRHRPGAGPKLVFVNQGADITLSTLSPSQVTVDPGSFDIVENGPVRIVARLKGHFSDPQGRSLCTVRGQSYERFGFTLIATFERGRRDVLLEYHFRNEASDALFPPWTDETVIIRQASFEIPVESSPSIYFAGDSALRQTNATHLRIEQAKGSGTPWTRRSQILVGNSTVETGVSMRNPFLGASTSNFVVAAQIPWMRYREPQAIEVRSNMLSLQFISQELVLGEGKGIWNFAKISFIPKGQLAAAALAQEIETSREKGRLQLERGLLVRAPLEFVNAAGVFPSLGTLASSPIKTAYTSAINLLHNQTVRDGGQWDRAKTFGSQLWPDVQRDVFAVDYNTPAENNAAMNYWNPSGAELLEFLRTGDPKWVWDFALPQSWLQMFTAYLNIGDHSHGNRNGLSVTSGGTGEGQWHRGAFGSDDYTYNVGMSLAYALRPTSAFRDRFAQAGRTVLDRYNIPKASEAQREEFVNQIAITRQAVQHFEMLANAAEFVPGSFGSSAHSKLNEIVSELARDNLRAGVMAEGDRPAVGSLSQPQQFMQTSMMYPFFHRYFRNYGDIDGHIRRALTQGPLILYRDGIEKQPDGRAILVAGGWASRPENALSPDATEVVGFTRGLDSDALRDMYNFNKPQTIALLLIAHSLDPSVNLCSVARQAYDNPAMADYLNSTISNEAGWWKGANQAMQTLVFGVGLYDTCQ